MKVLEEIYAYGHENISCTHNTTIEITKDKHLTKEGKCILGINASKACFDINPHLKEKIKNRKRIYVSLKVGNLIDTFYGYGSEKLTLMDKNDMVFRKSDFICSRTILIKCTKSSSELKKDIIKVLNDSKKKITITFELNDSDEKFCHK